MAASWSRPVSGSSRDRSPSPAGRSTWRSIRPSDLFAVLNKSSVFLAKADGVVKGSEIRAGRQRRVSRARLDAGRTSLLASTEQGHVQIFQFADSKLALSSKITITPPGLTANPVPGGMAITRDGSRLFVAAANRNAVVEVDLARKVRVKEYPVENLPFEPRLSDDESTLIVSNWGGRLPRPGDRTAKSQYLDIVVDERGAPASGTVSLIDLKTGSHAPRRGRHPSHGHRRCGRRAYVANAMSDSISEIDLNAASVTRTIPLRWGSLRVLGGMPNALAIRGKTLYVADGGDNAVAEVDLDAGQVRGYRPAGYFPVGDRAEP